MSLTAHPSSSSRPISNSTPKQGPPPPPSRLQYVQLAPSASHLERSPLSVSHSSRAPVPVLKSLLTYSTRPFTFFLALSTLHLHSAAESRSLLDLEHNILHPFPVFPSYIYFSHSLERFLSCFVKPCGGKEKKIRSRVREVTGTARWLHFFPSQPKLPQTTKHQRQKPSSPILVAISPSGSTNPWCPPGIPRVNSSRHLIASILPFTLTTDDDSRNHGRH